MPTYYEDIEVGDTEAHGSYEVTEDEIVEFAEQYDPQEFHTDPEAAEDTMFGGLAASGWHTAAVCMRLLVETMEKAGWASQGARGVDELRWIKPVRPGDELSIEYEVVEKREGDRPGVGEVDSRLTGYNQDDEPVITWIGLGMIEKRAAGE
ncbi:MaoC family dehydratase [Halorientalis pallida]|jgi:acyl dehydratase|uniref:Acyl dehydratase n=1 Tax=Halorientalis regularis TaxID=660518 RepID=A0A1G7HPF2_9EURY|nr:MaoC family dehydratase [Halorientalis regularis]SDF02323.1 Acyl dehydratase [Halorientalis regularis]